MLGVIWAILWLATWLSFRGMRLSARLSSSGVLLGTIILGLIVILLEINSVRSGEPLALRFSLDALIPKLDNLDQPMLLATMLISFVGMEISAAHVNDVKDPSRSFPRAIFARTGLLSFCRRWGRWR